MDIETIDLFNTLKEDITTTVKNTFQEEMALLKSSLPNIINDNVNTPKTLRLNNSLQMNMTYPKMNVLELFFNCYNENFSLKRPALRFAEGNESAFRSAKSRAIKVITAFEEVLGISIRGKW